MIHVCTHCGDKFDSPPNIGRPPSFCGDKCRKLARALGTRRCTNCSKRFNRHESRWPNHCGDACHGAHQIAKALECRGCGTQLTETDGNYCSAQCLERSHPPKHCERETCDNRVRAPKDPPYNRLPRYCSAMCRQEEYESIHGHSPANDDWLYQRDLRALPRPLETLPTRSGGYLPYLRCSSLAIPPQTDMSPKLRNSIAYWNHLLPTIKEYGSMTESERSFFIAWTGTLGWGGPDTPTGCLPVIPLYPVLNTQARGVLTPTVQAWWSHRKGSCSVNPTNHIRQHLFLIELITNWQQGVIAPSSRLHTKYFRIPEGDTKPLIYRIMTEHLANAAPPPLSLWVPSPYLESVTDGPMLNLMLDLNAAYVKEAQPGQRPAWAPVKYPAAKPTKPTRWETLSESILTRTWT